MLKRLPLVPALILSAASVRAVAADHFPTHAPSAVTSLAMLLGGLVVLAVLFGLYFLPTIIAFNRAHPNRVAILLVNLFFGATFIGWIICLIWALTSPTVIVINQVGPGERLP